jgi:transposase
MEHVGIDLGSKLSQVCIVRDGKIVDEFRIKTKDLPDWFVRVADRELRIVMESCAESTRIAEAAERAGHSVYVIAATKARTFGVGARKKKNDKLDARALAMYSYRVAEPEGVHLKSDESREIRRLVKTRAMCVKQRTAMVNQVKSRLREELLPTGARFSGVFTERARAQLLELARSEAAESPSSGEQPAASNDETSPPELELELAIEVMLATIDFHSDNIKKLDADIRRLAKAEARAQLLQTVPGVGPITALLFVATIDTVERFDKAEKVAEYLGLTPGEATTGFKPRLLGITKAGPSLLRTHLVQGAWTLRRTRPNDPAVLWAERISQRRNKRVATVALARKMAVMMFAMLRDGTVYDPKQAAAIEAESDEAEAA